MTERDFKANPYSPAEERVARFLSERGLGGGDDPVGFILASHAMVVDERNALKEAKGLPFGRDRFPLYLMVVDGKRTYLPLRQAGVLLDSWFSKVDVGGSVLEADFTVRDITDAERAKLSEIADEHSDSK